MKVTSEKSTIRSVEVRFTIEDLKKCLRFDDEDGNERGLPFNVILNLVTPDRERAPNIWEIVATFDEEVDDNEPVEVDPLAPEVGSQAAHRQGVVLFIIERNGVNGRGITDDQIVKQAKKFGVGESPAKKARRALVDRELVVQAGTRRARGKTTGQPRTIYKLAGR